MRSKLLFTLLISSFIANPSWALQHSLDCDGNGMLRNYKATGGSQVAEPQGDRIPLNDPVDSYYSNRSSDYSKERIQELIRMAVHYKADPYYLLSLLAMENPKTLKLSPADRQKPENAKQIDYESRYGPIPLDGIAMMDLFKCKAEEIPTSERVNNRVTPYLLKDFSKNEDLYKQIQKIDQKAKQVSGRDREALMTLKDHNEQTMLSNASKQIAKENTDPSSPEFKKYIYAKSVCSDSGFELKKNGPTVSYCKALMSGPKEEQVFHIADGPAKELCLSPVLGTSGSSSPLLHWKDIASYPAATRPAMRACCAQFEADTQEPYEVVGYAQYVLGLKFIDNRIETGQRIASNLSPKTEAQKMAIVLQAFNGYGTVGVGLTESTNSCIDGLNFKKSPIYGAGTAELTLNMFMNNPTIRKMVQDESKGKPVRSVFCESLGKGTHSFEGTQFARIQENTLSKRSCPRHTYDYKTSVSSSYEQKPQGAK